MEAKETLFQTGPRHYMVEDTEFYKYIFKKTEKIVCTVFYILRVDEYIRQDDVVIRGVEETANALLATALQSLKGTPTQAEECARNIQHALIALEAQLRIAHASRILRDGYLEVFVHEIDSVQRALRKYIDTPERNPILEGGVTLPPFRERHERNLEKRKHSGGEEGRHSGVSVVKARSRREQIKDCIKDKGEATIKDIAEKVTDCSEKTIQRELIEMIKDNVIVREGERRWSKYKLL